MTDTAPRRCHGTAIHGRLGGVRMVTGCPNPPLEGGNLCSQHQNAEDYQKRQFEHMMTHSTRHSRQVAFHGKGVSCMCGKFVKDGDVHPWGVPGVVEDHLDELLKRVPLSSFGADVQEAIAAFHNGSSHPLLDQLAEQCREIEQEHRAGLTNIEGDGSDRQRGT